jgi:3-oxoacyl-[acyl-carrier-protein] synthase-3
LSEAWEEGKIKKGDIIVLAAFGAGFSWGSNIIRWG